MEVAARKIHQKQDQEAYFGQLIQQEQSYSQATATDYWNNFKK